MSTDPFSSGDPLHGNRASDLVRLAIEPVEPAPVGAGWEPPLPEDLARLLPQYQIGTLLGRGGMGAVFQGVQLSLNRKVAIKVLPGRLAASGDFVERFRREAQILGRLQHPGIVAVHDFGQTSEGHLYFVMEFVDGTDLHQIIQGPGLSPSQALEFTIQICEALHYAHANGVVHRDIKPANVLVTRDGRAKLADFGLARPSSPLDGPATAASIVAGTPDYMAPEQWEGKADHRADIYALGVMLYEMLTGTRPKGAFPMPSKRANVDARLDQVVVKAMRQEPESRYQQISDLRLDVERIRTSQFSPESPVPPGPAEGSRRRKKQKGAGSWVGWVLSGTALAVVGVLVAVFATKDRPETGVAGEIPEIVIPEATLAAPPSAPNPLPTLEPVIVPAPIPVQAPIAAQASAPLPVAAPPVATLTPGPVPAPVVPPIPAPVEAPVPVPPERPPLIQGFSAEAPNLMAWCLAPLEEEVPADIRQNLTYLREDLVDEGKTEPAASIDAYRAAYYLCEALIASLDERNRARVAAGYRAAQADADKRVSNSQLDARRNYQMSWPQYHREESQRAALREQETNGANLKKARIPVDWSTVTERSRGNLDRLYRQFRAAMRG